MRSRLLWFAIGCLILNGCFSFGPSVVTTAPSAEQVARCRSEMYLAPDLSIEPAGFSLVDGPDDMICFRFDAKTKEIGRVFDAKVVDTTKFVDDYTWRNTPSYAWWDASSQKLRGGSVSLPKGCRMEIGYVDNENGTLTVYVFWHST